MTDTNTQDPYSPLTLQLSTVPNDDRPVYVVGNFNEWKECDEQHQMEKIGAGKYQFIFSKGRKLPSPLLYKYTRGEWADEELDAFGNTRSNRKLLTSIRIQQDRVPRWRDSGLEYKPKYLPQIRIISEEFEIPQLVKTRRIAALLPYNYDKTDKRYPVLYLQDGQNLFDDYAPFGSWGVDKKLAILQEQGMGDMIIISIDHAESERLEEFTPSIKTKLGVGEGKKYVAFLRDTLKPFVDKTFRTIPDREHTGIGGSSMGGLISIYAGLISPEVYDKLMIFSPALWVINKIPFSRFDYKNPHGARVYLYAGGKESEMMIPNVERFKEAYLKHSGNSEVEFELAIDAEGLHNEARWGQEFPQAIKWLFFAENAISNRFF
ncbi:MAG: alpha/beta hydrolase [Saprospiraceae bacterium]